MPWAKGQSGNPKGRKRSAEVLELVQLARAKCPDAISKAIQLVDSEDEKVAMQAVVFLRDTGMGRPSQVEFDLAMVPDHELLAEVRRRRELAAERERVEASRRIAVQQPPDISPDKGALQ